MTESDNQHVQGSVINGDQREYACSIGEGSVSCECADHSYRNTICKHLLAFSLRILQTEKDCP